MDNSTASSVYRNVVIKTTWSNMLLLCYPRELRGKTEARSLRVNILSNYLDCPIIVVRT